MKGLVSALFASACFATGAYAASDSIQIDADDIGGVVKSAKGPEAGVWVLAETRDFKTRYIKEVVTDDQGRYVLPDLPKAKYKIWVRGYGLVDSKPVDATPGKHLDLTAVIAPNAQAAAQIYPSNYWYSLIRPPAADQFPGTGAEGNGIAPTLRNQYEWISHQKNGCFNCHQLGSKLTREPANNSVAGWAERLKQQRPEGDPSIGDHGAGYSATMQNTMARFGRDSGLKMYADWTQRIAKGEVPEAPPRPAGIERNLVITIRDWETGGSFIHDEASTDRRNPTVNANGPIYGTAGNVGKLAVIDPVKNTTDMIDIPGANKLYPHTVVLDGKGRPWITNVGAAFLPPPENPGARPDFCSSADNKFAKYYPMGGQITQIHMYDPATKVMSTMPDCFRTHHLMFKNDADNTLFFTGDANVVGWVNTKMYDETKDLSKAMGWCPMVLDTKERGATKVAFGDSDIVVNPDRTQWNEPDKPQDPKKDTRISTFLYGIEINPVDGSIWFAANAPNNPSGLVRFERGSHPPETCRTEYYQPPKLPEGGFAAFGVKGVALDSNGIAWAAFTSGQMASFDRSKCKVMNGPASTGQHCAEGWKFYQSPGPNIGGLKQGYANADYYYQVWVDLKNSVGLGSDVAYTSGVNSDSLVAIKQSGEFVTLRIPYPLGFFSRWMDMRIDDPTTGWKGRGLWSSYSDVPVWHQEGGNDGEGPELAHFQLRPDPLAH